MSRCIVNVATGGYVRGQQRLVSQLPPAHEVSRNTWANAVPDGCPPHSEKPYAFKAYALKHAADRGATSLLWLDACIVLGARPLADLWEKIESDGYWIANNGWTNYEWTATQAYDSFRPWGKNGADTTLEQAREINKTIPHVVATAFGISLKHETGRAILAEYYRLASETNVFCGPWTNTQLTPCGPPDVRGHRHDQTALSVIAWRLGCKLSNCPEWFSYRGGETDKTCLIADGAY